MLHLTAHQEEISVWQQLQNFILRFLDVFGDHTSMHLTRESFALGLAAYMRVHSLACCWKSLFWRIYCFATTASCKTLCQALYTIYTCYIACACHLTCGSFGSGDDNKACKLSRAVFNVRAGDHWSFRMSRHMAPFALLTFGGQTFVMNRIFGGTNGY